MDLAHTLLRSTARSFYPPEQIIILDAILMHSALRDDDLAHLVGQQTKALRKICAKLKEDGLIAVHSRQETREGANRPFARDYYFIDTHRAIDVVKYRLKSMAKRVDAMYGQAPGEKKEYRCPRCQSAYTQMEVLDDITPNGILCKRCRNPLEGIADDGAEATGAHEVQSRLNAQMQPFEELLRRIDGAEIPENTFDEAISRAVPVTRDSGVNPVAKTTVVEKRLPPQTVHGMKTEERVEISLMDDAAQAEQEKKEAEAMARFREQNQLPSWYTGSTIGEGAVKREDGANGTQNGGAVGKAEVAETKFDKKQEEEEEQKKADEALLNSIYDMEADNDDDDDDSDESEDEDEEEKDDEKPPVKRVKIEEPTSSTNGNAANGISKEIEDAYADSDEDSGDEE